MLCFLPHCPTGKGYPHREEYRVRRDIQEAPDHVGESAVSGSGGVG